MVPLFVTAHRPSTGAAFLINMALVQSMDTPQVSTTATAKVGAGTIVRFTTQDFVVCKEAPGDLLEAMASAFNLFNDGGDVFGGSR